MKKFSSEVLVALEIFFTAPQLWPPATISEDRLGVSEIEDSLKMVVLQQGA